MLSKNKNRVGNISDSDAKVIKVTFNSSDSKFLSDIAHALGISEEDVVRKGLKLMSLYAEALAKEHNTKLILEGNKSRQELSVI